jgi:hypothetical protein
LRKYEVPEIAALFGEIMKFVLAALLISTQFASAAYGQDKPKPDNLDRSSTALKSATLPEPVDYDYAWDEFNHRGRLIWTCRGIQSDAFVPAELCKFKPKIDSQWPDKEVPGNWKE